MTAEHQITTQQERRLDGLTWWRSYCSCEEYRSGLHRERDRAFETGWDHAMAKQDPEIPPTPDLYTVAEVAKLARVSRMTIYRLVHVGGDHGMAAIQVGHGYRIPREEVEKLLRGGCLGGTPKHQD